MAYYEIGEIFQKIEEEMIASMKRNLERHLDDDYSMWQAEQLAALNEFRKNNPEKFKKYFSTINDQIDEVLKKAYSSGKKQQDIIILEALKKGWSPPDGATDMLHGAFFKINDRKLNALIEATKKDIKSAETAMLRKADDEYRKIVFNAEAYYNTGTGTLSQCVDMATKDFLSKGITCIEYANGARVGIDAYSRMAIRTAQTRAYLQGESEKRDEWGVNTVIMNRRGAACPQCVRWAGKVLYDDVWGNSKIPEPAKYPRLSEAIADGLYHPNCKDIHTTYFEGISSKPKSMTKEQIDEANRVYNLEQRQRYNERQIRKYKRLSENSVDPENQKRYQQKLGEWQMEQRKFISENGDVLKRRYDLEKSFKLPKNLQFGSNSYEISQDLDNIIKEDPCAGGHTWTDKIIKEPKCEEPGERLFTCSICGKEEAEEIPATGHQYGLSYAVNPTCTEEGYKYKTCHVCGHVEKYDFKPALGHDFGDWIITRQPTVAAYGRKQKMCGRCGEKKYTTIPKLRGDGGAILETQEQRIISEKSRLQQEITRLSQEQYTGIWSTSVTPADYTTKLTDIDTTRRDLRVKIHATRNEAIDELFATHNGDISKISYALEKQMGLSDKQKYGLRYSQLQSASDPKEYIKSRLQAYHADQQALLDKIDKFENAGKEYLNYSKQIKDLDDQLKTVRKDLMSARGIDPDALRSEISSLTEHIEKLKGAGTTNAELEKLLSEKIDEFEKIKARYDLPDVIKTGRAGRTKSAEILDSLQTYADSNSADFKRHIQKTAQRLGISEDEARKRLSAALSDITENCDIGMRIKAQNLEKVLNDNDGGFKNLFEVGTGGGCPNQDARGGGEQRVFGYKNRVPGKSDAGDRPVYGMMIPKLDVNGSGRYADYVEYIKDGPGAWYGDGVTCVINKEKVYGNTSFTLGDSLDYKGSVYGSTFDNPTFNGAWSYFSESSLLDSTKSANDRLISTFDYSDHYLEIQIHGKENHSADIIEKVYFTKSAADRARNSGLLSKLDAKKIPYEILN